MGENFVISSVMKLLKVLFAKIKRLFKKQKLTSVDQEHWVYHTYDQTKFWPNSAAMWANVHGFEEGPGQVYWVGVDVRSFGIRVADFVIKCKNKATADEYLNMPAENVQTVMKYDSRLNYRDGDDVEIKFIFKWSDEDKSFNVRFGTDAYAEEK